MAGKYVNTDKGRRWQNADGTYAYVKPGGGAQFGAEIVEFLAPGTNQRTAEIDQKTRDLSGRTINTPPSFMTQSAPNFMQQQLSGSRGSTDSDTSPRIELKPGPWDPGYKKPKHTVMDVIPEAAADPGRRATDPPRQILPREETVVNAAGVTQTGRNLGGGGTPTNMGKSYAALISEMNLQGYGTTPKFGSNQIPLTESSPDQPLSTAGQDVLAAIKAGPATDRTVEGYTQPNYTSINPSDPIFAEAFGQDLADQRIAESGAGNLPGITSSRLSDALKDTASMQGTMSDTPENRRLMARAAMLSDNDIMQNLKVRDAQQGKVYAGGQHYIAGEKEDSPAIAIDRGQARDISSGKTNANALLQAHITKNKDIVKDTPASSQDPAVPFADSPNLKVSKPGAAGYSLTGRDFKLNNDDVGSGFGASVNIGNKKGKDYGYTMPGL